MTVTLNLPDDLAAQLAACPDADEFAAAVLADALDAGDNDGRNFLARINAAYPAENEAGTNEDQEFSRLRRCHHRAVVGREEVAIWSKAVG